MKRILITIVFILSYMLIVAQMSPKGTKLLTHYEGDVLRTYADVGGIPTIGRGHTGKDVKWGMTISQDQSDAYLMQDTKKFSDYVNKKVPLGLPTDATDAYIDLTYNAGFILRGSLLDAIIWKDGNRISYHVNQICRTRVNGILKIIPGLLKRRHSENVLRETGELDFERK